MAGAYPGFCGMKQLRVLLLPLNRMLVHRRVTPSSMSPVPILYTWVERDNVMTGTGRGTADSLVLLYSFHFT